MSNQSRNKDLQKLIQESRIELDELRRQLSFARTPEARAVIRRNISRLETHLRELNGELQNTS